jgi:hypothetical protein
MGRKDQIKAAESRRRHQAGSVISFPSAASLPQAAVIPDLPLHHKLLSWQIMRLLFQDPIFNRLAALITRILLLDEDKKACLGKSGGG